MGREWGSGLVGEELAETDRASWGGKGGRGGCCCEEVEGICEADVVGG